MAETKTTVATIDNKFIDGLCAQLNMKAQAGFSFPEGYSISKELTAAYLTLQELKDKNGKPVLEVCTKASVANSLMNMATLGLSVMKKQGYFIAYGNQLIFQRSYFGNLAMARRVGLKKYAAEVIYKNDDFEYEIVDGVEKITKHKRDFKNINSDEIIGAYAVVWMNDGEMFTEIMNIDQIQKAWGMGATKGNSPAHKNFPDQMAKKTVINRALKVTVNSSPEGWLSETEAYTESESFVPSTVVEAEIEAEANKEVLEIPAETPVSAHTEEKKTKANNSTKKAEKAESEQISLDEMGF